jgi:hypothetical protein
MVKSSQKEEREARLTDTASMPTRYTTYHTQWMASRIEGTNLLGPAFGSRLLLSAASRSPAPAPRRARRSRRRGRSSISGIEAYKAGVMRKGEEERDEGLQKSWKGEVLSVGSRPIRGHMLKYERERKKDWGRARR